MIAFDYARPSKLYMMADLIGSLSADEKSSFNDMNLVLMKSKENDSIYICDIHEIMFDDINLLDDTRVNKIYDNMSIKYGNSFIDKIILKDQSIMKSKLNKLFDMICEMPIKNERLEFQIMTHSDTKYMQNCIIDSIFEYPYFINYSYEETRFSNIILCNYKK